MHTHTKISTFIKSQFPRFYDEEGPALIDFITAYYEWMESDGGVIKESRELPDNLDIDTTLDKFLEHFQATYLFGIPEQIKGNKRFLIKHILDVYRSKGSIQGFKLLFRLLYNEDIDVYLPSEDILRASDGTWYEPKYIEVAEHPDLPNLVGNIIQGSTSRAEAVVEQYIQMPVNNLMVHILYLSNIKGEFSRGEKIFDSSDVMEVAVLDSSKIMGSLNDVSIISGGQGFRIGDSLKITQGRGIEGEVRVSEVANGTGTLAFSIDDGGSLFSSDATAIITRATPSPSPLAGRGANFEVGALTNIQEVTFNTQIIGDYKNLALNLSDWDMDGVLLANINCVMGDILDYTTKQFGTIASLDNIETGNNYPEAPSVTVRDLIISRSLQGNVYYSNTSQVVTGVGTTFTDRFAPGSVIRLVGDPGFENFVDHRLVKAVTNNTSMVLDDYPRHTSNGNITEVIISKAGIGYSNNDTVNVVGTGTGAVLRIITDAAGAITGTRVINAGSGYYAAPTLTITSNTGSNGALLSEVSIAEYQLAVPTILASFAEESAPISLYAANGTINGMNEEISATPLSGSGIISKVQVKNSGFKYVHGERVSMSAFGAISTIHVDAGGTGYANGQPLVFSGGSPVTQAEGYIETNNDSSVKRAVVTYLGSGYKTPPTISIISADGVGAVITAEVGGLNTMYKVTGVAGRGGLGRSKGYWTTTRGFLSSDKYIQDSHYYQEYSYEIQAPMAMSRYADIVKRVAHIAGNEMFGRVVQKEEFHNDIKAPYTAIEIE